MVSQGARLEVLLSLRDRASRGMQTFGSRLDRVSNRLRAMRLQFLAVTGAVAAFAAVGVKSASALNEQMNRANVVFGDSVTIVQKFAEESALAFRLSKREAFEYTSVMGRILQASGLTAEASANMSVELLKVAGDLSSVSDTPMPDVLRAIRSGLVGEIEPLRRFGVLLSQTNVQNKAVELGLIAVGEEMTEGQKVMARSAFVMEALSFAQGDAANTANTAAGRMAEFRAASENMQASIGLHLLPVFTKFLTGINNLIKGFTNLSEPTQKTIVFIGLITGGVAALLLVLPFLISGIAAVGVAFTFLAAHPLILAIGALTVAAVLLWRNWDRIWPLMQRVFATVANFFIDRINEMIVDINRIIDVINLLPGVTIPALKEFQQVTLKAAEAVDTLSTETEKLGEEMEFSNKVLDEVRNRAKTLKEEVANTTVRFEDFTEAIQGVGRASQTTGRDFTDLIDKVFVVRIMRASGQLRQFIDDFEDLGFTASQAFDLAVLKGVKDFDAALIELSGTVFGGTTILEAYRQGIITLEEAFNALKSAAVITGPVAIEQFVGLRAEVDKTTSAVQRLTAAMFPSGAAVAAPIAPAIAGAFSLLAPGESITGPGGGVWDVEAAQAEFERRMAEAGFAHGGIVPGPIGMPRLAVVHGGETVTPPGRGGVTVIVQNNTIFGMDDFEQMVGSALRNLRLRGGGV